MIYRATLGDRRLGDLLARLRHDGCGGRPQFMELITAMPGARAVAVITQRPGQVPRFAPERGAARTSDWPSAGGEYLQRAVPIGQGRRLALMILLRYDNDVLCRHELAPLVKGSGAPA